VQLLGPVVIHRPMVKFDMRCLLLKLRSIFKFGALSRSGRAEAAESLKDLVVGAYLLLNKWN
jgi:hypothetical protein